jgi:hypothetical protein
MRNTTKKQYEHIIEQYSDLDSSNPDDIYKHISKLKLSTGTIKNIMCAFKYAYSTNKEIDETVNDKYTKIINSLSVEMSKKEKFVNKFPKIKWESFLIDDKSNSVDNLIRNLYTQFPPRRISDYAFMKYVDNMSDASDHDFNYYVLNKKSFVFLNFKTIHAFGDQTFIIPDSLNTLIKNYIIANDIKPNHQLLAFSSKDTFCTKTLSRHLVKIFHTPVDGIRHAYISWIYKKSANLLNISDISKKMAHNISTHLSYLDKHYFE